MTSLWGELPEVPIIVTPAKILTEQAAELQGRTSGIVIAEVKSVTASTGRVGFELRAIVPALNNYRIRIVHVEHGVMSYPCTLTTLFGGQKSYPVTDQFEFIELLKSCLSNPDLMKTFSNLMAQVQAASG